MAIKIGNLNITVVKSTESLLLRINGHVMGVESAVTAKDLERLATYLRPAPDNEMDLKLADEIVSVGLRALARKAHPDAGGSTEKMKALNNAADRIKERIGG